MAKNFVLGGRRVSEKAQCPCKKSMGTFHLLNFGNTRYFHHHNSEVMSQNQVVILVVLNELVLYENIAEKKLLIILTCCKKTLFAKA